MGVGESGGAAEQSCLGRGAEEWGVFKTTINLSRKTLTLGCSRKCQACLQQRASSSALCPARHPPPAPNSSCTQNAPTHLPASEQCLAITKKAFSGSFSTDAHTTPRKGTEAY